MFLDDVFIISWPPRSLYDITEYVNGASQRLIGQIPSRKHEILSRRLF